MAVASVTDAAIHKQIFGSNTRPSNLANLLPTGKGTIIVGECTVRGGQDF